MREEIRPNLENGDQIVLSCHKLFFCIKKWHFVRNKTILLFLNNLPGILLVSSLSHRLLLTLLFKIDSLTLPKILLISRHVSTENVCSF
uniref:Uncharacterized protein n=1 Tax=Lepeophtheirus salmonis TaxID=72036 RepID=A0A0K2T175_LEPSM